MKIYELVRDHPESSLKVADWQSIEPISAEMPPRVFQTWETNRFGRTHMMSLQFFRLINNQIEFHFLDAKSRDEFMRFSFAGTKFLEIYERSLFGPLRADLFRYGCLYKLGGIYFDISKAVFSRPLSSFCPSGCRELLTFESTYVEPQISHYSQAALLKTDRLFAQWGLGFAADHPILETLISQIEVDFDHYRGKYFSDPKSAILNFSGPVALTRAVMTHLRENPRTFINQIDVDFEGRAVLGVPGAAARYKTFPSYAEVKDAKLFI